MNAILQDIIERRNGHYCHVLEVETVYDLENAADAICSENIEQYGVDVCIDFLESLEIYCLDDNNEGEAYNFSFTDYINEHLI